MASKLKIFCSAVLSGCTSAGTGAPTQDSTPDPCEFSAGSLPNCQRTISAAPLEFRLQTERLYEDELALAAIEVRSPSGAQLLPISPDISIIEGDKGYISFPDINFDSVPDLAITTSFGTPNLYLNYWVYQSKSGAYRYIGNLPKLEIDLASRTLSARVKENAATYDSKAWIWQDNELVEQPLN